MPRSSINNLYFTFWRCPAQPSSVYVKVARLSVIRLSVSSIDSSNGSRRVCYWASCGQDIAAGAVHATASAGSVTLRADRRRRLNSVLFATRRCRRVRFIRPFVRRLKRISRKLTSNHSGLFGDSSFLTKKTLIKFERVYPGAKCWWVR